MAESTVQIKLVTTADTSGAQQATGAMDKVEAGITEVGQESKKTEKTIRELEAELRKTREALRDLTPNDARLPVLRQEIAQLEGTLGKAGVGGRNFGYAMMTAGRGIQDFQAAGIPGVTNNVEGLVTAMGGPAGLAGILTIVAVGFQVLQPHIAKFFNSLDAEGEQLDDLKSKLSAAATAILGEWTPATQAAEDASDAFTGKLAAEKAALDALEGSLKSSLDILKQRNKLQSDIGKNEDEAKIKDIKSKGLPKEEESRQIARVKIDRLNAEKTAAEEELRGEKKQVDLNLSNADNIAKQAEERRQKLAAEKQRALLQAELAVEIGGAAEVRDKDGNIIAPARKGAVDRVKEAGDNVAGAERLRGLPGIDAAFAEEQRIKAQQQLAQEKQRLADLQNEAEQNIRDNGGTQFRDIAIIDKDLGGATPAAKAAADKREAARKAQAELDVTMDLRQQKITSDYRRDSGKILDTLPQEEERKRVERAGPDPFEAAEREKTARPRRNLAAEEAAGDGSFKGRNLAAEEKSGTAAAMKELLEASKQSDAALMAAIKQLTAEKKKLSEQIKNSRS